MTSVPVPRSTVLLLAATLLTTGLAGCIGSAGDQAFATFSQAREQAHATVEPEEDLDLRLGLIEPGATEDVSQGTTNVTLVLWDEGNGEPVTDAEVTVDAFMPMMGHGTDPETDPDHLRNGVYQGSTNLMMGGHWLLYLNATLASGEEAHFEIDVQVAGGGHDDGPGDHGDHDDHEMDSGYDSYDDARDAEGETFEPEQDTTYRLKLLEPHPREGLDGGETSVVFLLYDQQADEPVTNGSTYLNATMPEMDHGASPEEDPVHAEHGVWMGTTTLSMNGTWILGIDARPDGGQALSWEVEVAVGNASGADDEPPFEPYEEVFEDDVSSAEYNVTHDLTVQGANATLTTNGTLENATPVTDELTVELLDPDGDQLGSFTLTADTDTSSLVVEDAPEGDYGVRVHGQAIDASYRVAVHVAPP